jgi:hypothetical protein
LVEQQGKRDKEQSLEQFLVAKELVGYHDYCEVLLEELPFRGFKMLK